MAGLLPGDVVVSFDGLAIETMQELAEAVSETEVGDKVTLVVERDGEDVVVTAKMGARPMPVQIQPGNIDELLEQMPPEMRERFREMLEQRPQQPEA
jgi:serine protease Do